ncbi:MAG: hypothetical protein EHM35_00140 [Planctomycetaceae bacterium]|nr:MAG: hypothetical protein EHM35_00140 [Planctomycetaceae bacterium]
MAREVIAAFYIDPVPPGTLEATFCHSQAAAVVMYRSPGPGCRDEVFAMYDAIMAAGHPLDGGQGGHQPGPGVAACIITTNVNPRLVATCMARALGAEVKPAYCPTDLVPDERYGLNDLIDRMYQEWCSRQLPAPAPTWQLVAPAPLLLAG